jgi:hypothetical protein
LAENFRFFEISIISPQLEAKTLSNLKVFGRNETLLGAFDCAKRGAWNSHYVPYGAAMA